MWVDLEEAGVYAEALIERAWMLSRRSNRDTLQGGREGKDGDIRN